MSRRATGPTCCACASPACSRATAIRAGPWHGAQSKWRYLEHDWIAEQGSYVFEPPGETHTLYVPEDVEEMITYFHITGVMFYCDPWGKFEGYEDVFTKLDMCRKHYEAVGLGADYVNRFVR
jgi:hypothetical protein